MSSHRTTIRGAFAPTIDDGQLSGRSRPIVAAIVQHWVEQSDEKVLRTIDAYPSLVTNKSLLLDLVLKEYKLRKDSLPVSREVFCEQFRHLGESMEQSIFRALEVQEYLDEHPELLRVIPDFKWPDAGDRLQGFQIVEEIGRGALARAYLCREVGVGQRYVVLKIARGVGYEAELLGRFDHPNIVPIYSVKNDADRSVSYICMPFRGRSTLQDLVSRLRRHGVPRFASAISEIARHSLTPEERHDSCESLPLGRQRYDGRRRYVDGVLELAKQLASALAHAHEIGVFHGDLKPSNVLLTPDGSPLLIDFNLATDRESGAIPRGGTLAYMPPEQLTEIGGGCLNSRFRVDARSEVYSFGALVYELLTGTVPYLCDSTSTHPTEIANKMLQRQRLHQPQIRATNPHVNAQLERLVLQCLAITPTDRPQSMVELQRSLRLQTRCPARIQRLAIARPVLSSVSLGAIAIALMCYAVFVLFRPPYQSRQLASGIALRQSQDFEAAIESFNQALDGDEQRRDVLYERAITYLKQGNLATAGTEFLQLWKDYADPHSAAYIGYCFNLQGNLTSAIPWYEIALKEGYESAGLHNNLGVSYAKGRTEIGSVRQLAAAKAHLDKALALDPESLTVRANLVMLVIMRSDDCADDELEQASIHLKYLRNAFPQSRRVMTDAVQLYGVLSLRDQAYVDKAIQAIELSMHSGSGPTAREFVSNPRFDGLRQDSRFASLQTAADASLSSGERDDLVTFIDPTLHAE